MHYKRYKDRLLKVTSNHLWRKRNNLNKTVSNPHNAQLKIRYFIRNYVSIKTFQVSDLNPGLSNPVPIHLLCFFFLFLGVMHIKSSCIYFFSMHTTFFYAKHAPSSMLMALTIINIPSNDSIAHQLWYDITTNNYLMVFLLYEKH